MTKSITLLGSTGSIGQSAVRVLDCCSDDYTVDTLVCGTNLDLLDAQVASLHPAVVAVADDKTALSDRFKELTAKYPDTQFLSGEEGVVEAASRPVDICLSAIVGSAGLKPTVAAIGNAKRIALANKEALVAAGDIVISQCKEKGTELIPVDSEHSAIFMLLEGKKSSHLDNIILTASGGSLRSVPVYDLTVVQPDTALQHPTWDMGKKITIDSATLMNKGLEVIEAHYLFDVSYDSINVVIHPQSLIHSMIETIDGAVYAHMGLADMAFPIVNAFTYPDKIPNTFGKLNLAEIGTIEFLDVEKERYPALDLCYAAGREGGTMTSVLNGANEIAVQAFLDSKIAYTDIALVVERVMSSHTRSDVSSLDDIYNADSWARAKAHEAVTGVKR